MLYLYIGRYRESLLLVQPAKLRKALQHLIRTCSHRPGSLYRHQTAYSFLHRFVEVKSNISYFSCQDAILLFTKLPWKRAVLFVAPLSVSQASMQILNFLAFFHYLFSQARKKPAPWSVLAFRLVTQERFELPTPWFVVKCSIQLSYWAMWQGQRDSNPQPTVLETVALSIALCPYLFDGSHHPCDLYIITNLFGNCKGFLQIFLKKDFGAKFRDLRKKAQRVLWGQWGGAVRNI